MIAYLLYFFKIEVANSCHIAGTAINKFTFHLVDRSFLNVINNELSFLKKEVKIKECVHMLLHICVGETPVIRGKRPLIGGEKPPTTYDIPQI